MWMKEKSDEATVNEKRTGWSLSFECNPWLKAISEKGFSALELSVSVLLISLVVAFALPDPDDSLSAFRIHSAARELTSDLALARMKAIAKNTSFRVSFNTTADTYVVEEDVAGTWQPATATRNMPQGIDLVSASNAVFQSTGVVQNSVTVYLMNPQSQTMTVVVSQAGRAKIQ